MATFALSGGIDAVPGWGQRARFRHIGTWAEGDTWTATITTDIQGDFTLGAGQLSGGTFNYVLVHANRTYVANGDFWSFSAIEDPTGWEQQNVGAGFQSFSNSYGVGDEAVSLSIIQGRLAVFGRYNIQIWNVEADPANFSRVQILQNSGTIAKDSVQSIGELDTLYLDDTGIRSLKTKETTLNAYVDDVGVPIDAIIQGILATMTEDELAQVKSVVDPISKRYWLYLDGKFYVLSSFPSSKIRAWSTYLPVDYHDQFNPFTFVPSVIRVFKGKVYIAHQGGLFLVYGGNDGQTYDYSVPTVELPWLNVGEPGTIKQACGLQAAFKGKWAIYASMNPKSTNMTKVIDRGDANAPDSLLDSTFDVGAFPYSATGSHLKLKAVGNFSPEAQTLSMLTVLFNTANKQ